MDRRLAYAIVGLVAVAALFFVFRPDDDEETAATVTPTATAPEPTTSTDELPTTEAEPPDPEPVRATIRISDGKPAGGLTRIAAKKGDRVLLVVRADAPDHVHVHGYDLIADVGPGRPASLRFRATITGRFEIELEDAHQQIAQLTVTA